jgi:hypothetical protein
MNRKAANLEENYKVLRADATLHPEDENCIS